jgi:D-alanyl-D-alanine carboxypeptidase
MQKKHVHATVWTSLAIIAGIFVSFGVMHGALYFSDHTSFFSLSDNRGPLSDSVIIEGQGGPEGKASTELGDIKERRYVVKGGATFPDISSRAFVVGDVHTGQIIASKRKNETRSIASLTKLMTAVIADEVVGLSKETTVSSSAISTYGASGNLHRGQRFSIEELLLPLLLSSSNDAGEAIAESIGRAVFMNAMNRKADELGMISTYYSDASGLSSQNVSTVDDLFTLVQYIQKYRRYIFDITTARTRSAAGRTWHNNTRFKHETHYIGGKNGYTDAAGKTNIALYRLPLGDENEYRDVAIIVFDSSDPLYDTRLIVNYLNKNVYYE